MSIQSDLHILQSSLSEKLAIDVSLVVQLRDAPEADRGLVIWPWHIETVNSQSWLPPRKSPDGEQFSSPPLRSKIHLLILASDFAILSSALDALHQAPVLMAGDRRLVAALAPLTGDQACSIFMASGVPMQAAISLTLEG